MRTMVSEKREDPIAHRRIDTETVRKWSAPGVILVVTDLLDEESLQFHAIQQARQSGAKVLVVEVDENSNVIPRTRHLRGVLPIESFRNPRRAAERMADHIRRAGIICEPVIVRGLRGNEIPAIASSSCADRVLLSAPIEYSEERDHPAIAEEIINGLNIPVCIVGRNPSAIFRYQRPSRRISLALSLRARNDIPIAFSSRLAQEIHSQLTIIYVLPNGTQNGPEERDVQASLVSHLPPNVLRAAGLLCPIEITVREGDPATEILNHEYRLKQDYLVLAPPRDIGPRGFDMGTVCRVIREAQCPVIVLSELPATLDGRPQASSNAGVAKRNRF